MVEPRPERHPSDAPAAQVRRARLVRAMHDALRGSEPSIEHIRNAWCAFSNPGGEVAGEPILDSVGAFTDELLAC